MGYCIVVITLPASLPLFVFPKKQQFSFLLLLALSKWSFSAGGNPYRTSVTQGKDGKMVEDVKDVVFHQARRTVEVAKWLKKGKA